MSPQAQSRGGKFTTESDKAILGGVIRAGLENPKESSHGGCLNRQSVRRSPFTVRRSPFAVRDSDFCIPTSTFCLNTCISLQSCAQGGALQNRVATGPPSSSFPSQRS